MKQNQVYPVLTIAGSDSSGGAGIQADIKTICAHGCYAMSAITSLTAQNTTGVSAIEGVSPSMVSAQIDMVFDDIPPLAVKTGMLYSKEIVHAVVASLIKGGANNIVVDPVMISTSGSRLISENAVDTMVRELFPIATIVTPNRMEAAVLTGESTPERQGKKMLEMGCQAVLVKGGDSETGAVKTDLLMTAGGFCEELSSPAVITPNTHGTGCTLSSAIASNLALGYKVEEAVKLAKQYIQKAIESGADYKIGHGHGPVNHFWDIEWKR